MSEKNQLRWESHSIFMCHTNSTTVDSIRDIFYLSADMLDPIVKNRKESNQ